MIAVEADLRVEAAGVRMRVDGRGSTVTCRLDGGAANLLEIVRRSFALMSLLRSCAPLLVRTGLRVDVVAGSRRLGSIGSGVEANAPARALRLPFTRLGP